MKAWCAVATLLLGSQPASAQPNVSEQPIKRVASGSCEHGTIACFQTKTAVIDSSDCHLGGGTYVDYYKFPGTVGQKVIVDMTSSVMDSYVSLVDPLPTISTRASDNDGGTGYDAHLEYTIADRPGDWYIAASHLKTLGLGAYSLTLRCSPSGPDSCAPDAATLCIDDQQGDRRFEIKIDFSTTSGGGASGAAKAISLAEKGVGRGGLFWFFSAENPELVVKVLNGCAINGSYWVFYSAATDVGLTLTVTDTQTGHTFARANPDHHPVDTVQATDALPCG
jgi:hypothetical protein